jgi:outer membrane protein assembly factor BamB
MFAHTVRVDPQDNIWVVDEGSNMIVKFNPEARVVMTMGRKPESVPVPEPASRRGGAASGAGVAGDIFNRPTDVAWDADGNIFVSDGYGNSRVAKFDKNGKFIKSWGSRGTAPGQFNTPHSIATDAQGNVYVADRGNHRIQVFDGEGKFLRQFTIDVPVPPDAKPAIGKIPDEAMMAGGTFAPGSPWSLCITPPPHQVLYSSDAWPGRIYKLSLEGKVLGMLGQSGKQLKQFGWIHAMACPSENVIYVAELLNWRVQKLILKP